MNTFLTLALLLPAAAPPQAHPLTLAPASVALSGKGTTLPITGLRPASDTPQWSPDDGSIAFTASKQSGDIRVYVIGADGSGLRRIA